MFKLVLVLLFFLSFIFYISCVDVNCLTKCKEKGIDPSKCFAICLNEVASYRIRDTIEFSDVEESSPVNPALVWEAYKTQLFDFIKKGSSSKGLQLLETPIVANWDLKPETLTDFCNQMSQWGPQYKPIRSLPFNAQYYKFLKNLKIEKKTDPKLEAEYQKAISDYLEAKKVVETKETECRDLYNKRRSWQESMTYEQYKSERCFTLKNAEINAFGFQLTVDRLKSEIAGKDAAAFEAISIYEKDTSGFAWKESFVSTLSQFKSKIAKDPNALNSFSIAVTKSTTQNIKRESEWKWTDLEEGKSKQSFIVTEKTQTQHEFSTSADIFKLIVTAKGFATIDVAPSSLWFLDVIAQYKNGPFINKENYFGETGSFNLMKQKIHLVYKPTISVFLNKEDTQYLLSLKEKKTVIKIGPFETLIEGSSEVPSTNSDESSSNSYKVDFTAIENDPLIIAVENIIL